MSAGTMMACAGKEIIMGNQSSLGPIDPQFSGIPAYNIVHEFEEAKEELKKDPTTFQYWTIKLNQYPAAFVKTAYDAIKLSEELAKNWLSSNMLTNNPELVQRIVATLNEHEKSKTHGRHFNIDFCQQIGLKVLPMENDDALQDKILSVHHSFMICFDNTAAVKIIQNQNGRAVVNSVYNRS